MASSSIYSIKLLEVENEEKITHQLLTRSSDNFEVLNDTLYTMRKEQVNIHTFHRPLMLLPSTMGWNARLISPRGVML